MDILITLSVEEETLLKSALANPEKWVRDAVSGKLFQCKKRLVQEWIPRLRREGVTIPADDAALLELIVKHPEYKDRATKDAPPVVVEEIKP